MGGESYLKVGGKIYSKTDGLLFHFEDEIIYVHACTYIITKIQ